MSRSQRVVLCHFALATASCAIAGKISVDRERTVNLGTKGDVYKLFDEQDLAGDPMGGTGGKPVTEYTNGYVNQALYYPMESVVDLGAVHAISDLWYYDINGSDSLQAWCGDGNSWTQMVSRTTSSYMAWVGVHQTDSCVGRYVKFRLRSPASAIAEVVLYGAAHGPIEPLPSPVPRQKPTLGALMGINGFVDDDRDLLQVVGHLREYHSWQWDDGNGDPSTPAYPQNRFGWNPSWVRGTGWSWNFDDFYGTLHGKGMTIAPVFQGTPAWMFGKSTGDSLKPHLSGTDSTLPASYLAHADYLWQFAARFGRTVVPASDLRVDALNTAVSGLGSVDWMEGWNEPDKNWKTVTGYFRPEVLAAMASADYDGDQARMGRKVGVRNADPTMKVALPGLISIDLEYAKAMKWWADRRRGGSFPADALNFHHYCNDGGGQGGTATTGISPETDGFRQRLETLSAWRDRNLPGKELWLSEFGWDTDAGSVFRAPAIGSADAYEIQGRWIVRAFLQLAASGFDRAQVFLLRDDWDNSSGKFATSGLVHDKYDTLCPKYQKKTSWYYVNTLHKSLRNYRFDAEDSTGGIHVYRFVHTTDPDSVAWAVWNENDAAAPRSVPVATSPVSGREIALASGQALGVSTALSTTAQGFTLASVDGRPRLVVAKVTSGTSVSRTGSAAPPKAREWRVDGRWLPIHPGTRNLEPRFAP